MLENVRVTDKKVAQNDPAVQEAVKAVAAFPIGAVIAMIAASFLKDAKNYQLELSADKKQETD